MKFTPTSIKDLVMIEPAVFGDDRGVFFETYHADKFKEFGITDNFVQDNHSISSKNTVRGLHFQTPPFAQSKLVRVVVGEVFDVAVDLRPDSATYGQWFGVTLSAENKKMLYVPEGFAHGFCVTSDTAHFVYKCGAVYNKESEGGVIWNDPDLGIDWPIDASEAIVSEKDQLLPKLSELK